jgi:hypothetical protein
MQDRCNQLLLSETIYIDRRYRNRESSNRSRYLSKLRYNSNNSGRNLDRNSIKKRCFICKKEGCWSTNYTKEERQQNIRQYITNVKGEREESSSSSNSSTTPKEDTANGLIN